MADFTDSKSSVGSVYPENAVESPWIRTEPLITPEKLRMRYLFGIPLVSRLPDPITKKYQVMTDDILSDYILRAVSVVETETHLTIFPVVLHEKHPFHRLDYESFGYFRTKHRPVQSVLKIAVVPANNIDVYIVPLDWVTTAYLPHGQINIVPITIATVGGATIPANSVSGAAFLSILSRHFWVPEFWQIDYVAGFEEGAVPRIVNELIGITATIDILSQLAATFFNTSNSLGIDGMSQSSAGPGPQVFLTRIGELKEKKDMLIKKLRSMYQTTLFAADL